VRACASAPAAAPPSLTTTRANGLWFTRDLFLIRESPHASDVLRLVVELPLPSVNVHRRPLEVATIVTQLVTPWISSSRGRVSGH
jgi:hypothetical protein